MELEVRKKNTGEANESNVPPGLENSLFFKVCRTLASHTPSLLRMLSYTCSSLPSYSPSTPSAGAEGGSEVARGEKSNTAFLVINPTIFTGWEREVRDSVNASEVQSVPPRKEP